MFVSSTAVHRYDFHMFTAIIHHFEGLPRSNIITSSQMASQFSWQSAAPSIAEVMGSNPVRDLNFFSGLVSTTSSVVFIAARISYIRLFTAVHIYDFHISTIIIHHLDGLFGPKLMTSSQLACQFSWQSAAPVSQRSWVQNPIWA